MIQGEIYYDLKAIANRDPDAGEVEPTPAAYAAHKAWAIATYGAEVWRVYSEVNWDSPEV